MIRPPLIGRDRELADLLQLIDANPLVTVWGPGGIGKTRLAEEILALRRGVFCDLSEARSEEDMAAVMSRFSSRDVGLLVLDNFEQVIDSAPAIRTLAGPNRVVVTSRERLRLEGEVCFEIGPLEVSQAMALFVERAGTQKHEIDEAQLRELVIGLDCIPLALELAAARHDVLGIRGLHDRIDRPISLLVHGPRDAPDRHATLEAAIAWSWDALSTHEQRALMQCSCFRGGFMLEAAEAVVDRTPALDLIQSLRDKSMLRVDARGSERRFGMLETVRDFSERKLLLSGTAREIWARHAAYFARLEDRREGPNLLIAVERSLEDPAGLSDDAVRALIALESIVAGMGPYDRYLVLLDRALAQRPREPKVLRARGKILQRLGRLDRAEADLTAALAIAEDAVDRGTFLTDLGVLRHQERRLDEAESLYRQALELHRAAGHRRAEGRVLGNLGALEHDRRAYDRAEAAYEAALAIDREVGDVRHEGLFLANLGILDHERGDLSRAALRYEDSLRILAQVKDDRLLAITLGNRGVLHQEMDALDAAATCFRQALELLGDVGDQRSQGLGLIRLATVEAMLGGDAAATLSSAEALLSRPRDELGLALAELAAAFLDLAAARRAWLGEAPEESHARLREARRRLENARSLLDRSDDARLFFRMLERPLSSFAADDPAALTIAPGARWFRAPSSSWSDLSRRHPIRRMLCALVESRLAGNRWLSLDQLQAAAWPGESIRHDAASNRVYVALTTLRKLGLAEVLVSGESGYRIDPGVPIAFCMLRR